MKKILAALFIGIFLFAVSRPVSAGDRRGVSAGALIGAAVGVITFGIFATAYSTSERETTNRRAIDQEHLTQREQIRASTVLAAPAALGGSGDAEYSSPEGTARIRANAQPVVAASALSQAASPQSSGQYRQPVYYYADSGAVGYGPRYGYVGYGQQPHPRRIFRENPQSARISKPDGTTIEMTR